MARGTVARSHGSCMFSFFFFKKMLICFLEWLYHFTVPLAVYETSSFCPFSPAFGGVTLSHLSDNFFYFSHSDSVWWYLIVCVCVLNNFIYLLSLAVLGLCCCAGFSLIAVSGLLIAEWLFLLQSPDPRRAGFSSCGSRALEHRLRSCGAGP